MDREEFIRLNEQDHSEILEIKRRIAQREIDYISEHQDIPVGTKVRLTIEENDEFSFDLENPNRVEKTIDAVVKKFIQKDGNIIKRFNYLDKKGNPTNRQYVIPLDAEIISITEL